MTDRSRKDGSHHRYVQEQYDLDIDDEAYLMSVELFTISNAASTGAVNSVRAATLLLEILGDLATHLFAGTFWQVEPCVI